MCVCVCVCAGGFTIVVFLLSYMCIDVAPISHLRMCVMKTVHIQWKSSNVILMVFHIIRNCI